MRTHTRTLFLCTIGAAMLAPVAGAQIVQASGQAAAQLQAPPLPPTIPPTVNDSISDAIEMAKPVRSDSDKVDTPMTPPVKAQGATHAAAHSMAVTHDVFARVDADADGRISASEAAADPDINGMFAAMDVNNDGFVTDVEFRAHAKADMP